MFKPTKLILFILFVLFGWNYFFGIIEVWPYSVWSSHFPLLSPGSGVSYPVLIVVDLIWQYFLACLFAYYTEFLFSRTKLYVVKIFLVFAVLSFLDINIVLGFSSVGGRMSSLYAFISVFAKDLFVYIVLLSLVAFIIFVAKLFQSKRI